MTVSMYRLYSHYNSVTRHVFVVLLEIASNYAHTLTSVSLPGKQEFLVARGFNPGYHFYLL